MKSIIVAFSVALLVTAGTAICRAQELPELPKPQKEHESLQRFVGEWESTAETTLGPDQPKMECKGTQRAHMLGGFWMIAEGDTDMMGTPIRSRLTLGYDPTKDKYVGTWVDSCTNYMWQYEGAFSEDGTTLTLDTEGPNFNVPGQTAKYREMIEFKNDDHYVFTSSIEGEGGEWITFVTAQFHRKNR